MAVFEVRVPTGYVVLNNELRDYVQSGQVPRLKYARFRPHFVHFFFDKVSFVVGGMIYSPSGHSQATDITVPLVRWFPLHSLD